MVRQMMHRLRYLLEKQDMENTLQEGEDVFQDLRSWSSGGGDEAQP